MKRCLGRLVVLMFMAGLLVGCTSKSATCKPVPGQVNICVNGVPIDFSAYPNKPHVHESGNIYVPLDMLATRLGVPHGMQLSPDRRSANVTVDGKPFQPAMATGTAGVHVHEGIVYVPVREFAAAAGWVLELNAAQSTAGFVKR